MNLKGEILIPSDYYFIQAKENYIYCNSFSGMIDIFDYTGKRIISFRDPIDKLLTDEKEIQKMSILNYYEKEEYMDSKDFFSQGWDYEDDTKGIFCFPLNGLWGAIDSLGNTIISHKYSSLYGFKVKNDFYFIADSKLLLNSLGEVIISGINDLGVFPGTDFIRSYKNNFRGVSNIKGKEILESKYKDITIISDSNFIVTLDNKKDAVIDLNEREIIPSKYDRIFYDNKDNYIIMFNEKEGVIDKDGRVLIPIKFDDIRDKTWIGFDSNSMPTVSSVPILYDLYIASVGNKKGFVDLNGVEYFEDN